MMNATRISPSPCRVFLASPTRIADSAETVEKKGLRWDAWLAAGKKIKNLFVAEFAWEDVNTRTTPVLEIATLLLGQVRLADAFICLLNGKSSGRPMQAHEAALTTTFFELELFQAIVLARPIFILVSDTFDADAIGPYLDLLEFGLPGWRDLARTKMNDDDILKAIIQIRKGHGQPWQVACRDNRSPQLHSGLLFSRDHFARQESSPKIHFLQLDRQAATRPEPNMDAILDLMRNRRSFEEEQNNDRRLAFSWLLMRELAAAPLLDGQGRVIQNDPVVLAAWNAALNDWATAAAWLGLHNHLHLGTVPAINTLESVRQVLRPHGVLDAFGNKTEFLGGAYASSYYSLSRRVHANHKHSVLDLAQKLLRMGWDDTAFNQVPGNLGMAGSIALEAGRTPEAVAHFEAMLLLHQHQHSGPRAMGEALCELAFAHFLAGQRARAVAEAREGVGLMQTHRVNGAPVIDGFLVRAMFKSAAIHLLTGKPLDGIQLYWQALRYAKERNLDDQARQWRPRALANRALQSAMRKIKRGA